MDGELPNCRVYGTGKDGGRELTFEGTLQLPGGRTWTGYGVVQAKYRRRLVGTAADQQWFVSEVASELGRWVEGIKSGVRKSPDYLLFATNVVVTPAAAVGGQDRLDKSFKHFRELKDLYGNRVGLWDLKDYTVWHADKIDRLLETHPEVRQSYANLVLPGDVITRLNNVLEADDDAVAHRWVQYVTHTLRSDQDVELAEAGDQASTPIRLADVAIDVPGRARNQWRARAADVGFGEPCRACGDGARPGQGSPRVKPHLRTWRARLGEIDGLSTDLPDLPSCAAHQCRFESSPPN